MNKIHITFLSVLIIILGWLPMRVNASNAGCGDWQDTGGGNKCCSFAILSNQDVEVKNSLGGNWDFLLIPINRAISYVSVPFNTMMEEITGKAIRPCANGVPSTPSNVNDPKCICLDDSKSLGSIDKLCQPIESVLERDKCSSCLVGGGIWSGAGCIKSDLKSFIEDTILRIGLGLAGGTSLLCIIFAAFQMQTSRGNAEKLKKAQELLTNCITGLMVIIFSMLILKIIGVDILRIPGFS